MIPERQSNGGLVPAGAILRQEFGATEVERGGETAATAIAARQQAIVQSRFVMAMQRPRSVAQFEQDLLKECERPGFAEVSRYRRPVGKQFDPDTKKNETVYAEGWSIRFAEAAIRAYRNVHNEATVLYEDDEKRIVNFSTLDLEANTGYDAQMVFRRTVERRKLKDSQEAIAERRNSNGDRIFIVEATDEEIQQKQAAQWSKFIRNSLRFMPGDILERCLDQVQKTLRGQSPEAARDRVLQSFDRVGVTLPDIQAFLGHTLSSITPVELDELRKIYTALKEHETTWEQVMAAKDPAGSREAQAEVAREKIERLKREAAEKQQEAKPQEAKPAEEPAEGKPEQKSPLADMEQHIGPQAFLRILGANGYERAEDVPQEKVVELLRDMEQELQDQRARVQGAQDKPAGFAFAKGQRKR